VDALLASLLSPITLAFVVGLVAAWIGLEIRVPQRALRWFANLLLFAIGVDGGRGLAAADLRSLAAGLAVTLALILLLPTLAYVFARHLTKFSVVDSAALAALYGSVSSAVLMAAYVESDDLDLAADGFVIGLAALMELGTLVALVIGTIASRRATGAGRAERPGIADVVGGGFSLLFVGLFIGSWIGDRPLGRIDTIADVILTGMLVVFMVEIGMVTAGELRKLRVTTQLMMFALLMPTVGGILGTLLAALAGLSPGSVFVLGAVAASASFINAPPLVRMSLPAANPSIYMTCALGITFPVLVLVGLPLIAQLASVAGSYLES
jgi:hypothetical protein